MAPMTTNNNAISEYAVSRIILYCADTNSTGYDSAHCMQWKNTQQIEVEDNAVPPFMLSHTPYFLGSRYFFISLQQLSDWLSGGHEAE